MFPPLAWNGFTAVSVGPVLTLGIMGARRDPSNGRRCAWKRVGSVVASGGMSI